MSVDNPPDRRASPPEAMRFRKGQSGNPRGRPRKVVQKLPYDHVFGQLFVTGSEGGHPVEIDYTNLFVKSLLNRAMKGGARYAKLLLDAQKQLSKFWETDAEPERFYITIQGMCSSVNDVALGLHMVRKYNRDGRNPHYLMEPWLVEASLERLGRRLTPYEQQVVWESTRTPHKVIWPEWWTERCGTGRRRPKGQLIDRGGFYAPEINPNHGGSEDCR